MGTSLQRLNPAPYEDSNQLMDNDRPIQFTQHLAQLLHQKIHGDLLIGLNVIGPGNPLDRRLRYVKTGKVVFRVLHVEPLVPPALGNVEVLELEVIHFGSIPKAEAPRSILTLFLRLVQTLPETPMRMDPKKTFAKNDKAGKMEYSIGGKVMQLDAVHA